MKTESEKLGEKLQFKRYRKALAKRYRALTENKSHWKVLEKDALTLVEIVKDTRLLLSEEEW